MSRQLLILLSICFHICISQNKSAKIIVDSKTKSPIDYVFVSSNDNKINLMSNTEGKLILLSDTKIKYFSFYKIGYNTQIVLMQDLIKTDTVFLVQKEIKLSEVTISANPLEAIVKDKRFYVDDYLVLPNNDFLIITTRISNNSKYFDVAYYKREKGITCSKKINNETNPFLFTDCFKNLHLVTDNYSRQLFFTSDSSFDFLPKYSKVKFDSTLKLCALKLDTQLLFKSFRPPQTIPGVYFNFTANSPFLTYIKVYKKNRRIFYSIVYNKEIREMLKSEISDSQALRASMDAADARRPSDQSYESAIDLFYKKVAKPIYAPVFLKNDTVVVFNFQEELIVFLTKTGNLLKEVKLNDKEISTYRDFEIIYDEFKQNFYFKTRGFDKTFLSMLNIYTGSLSRTIHLEKAFAKNIQIQNGKIYYLVKEKEWDDTCYLYEQKQ